MQQVRSTLPRSNAAIVPLLALVVFINYADRGNLATAAPAIKDQFGLSGVQFGELLSAFFWTYVPAQFCAGMIVPRFGAYRTLAVGLAVWSAATALTGLASGFASLLAFRLLLGLGESVTFPSVSSILAQQIPTGRLGAANGIALAGLGLGPAFGTYVGALLIADFGWRSVFLLFGLTSFAWLVPWQLATRTAHRTLQAQPGPPPPSYAALLRRRELWGTAIGHFCGLYVFYFVISWLPLYLVKSRGLTMTRMGEIGGLIFLVYAASTYLSGMAADRLIARGTSQSRVRKTGAVWSLAAGAACMAGAALGSANMAIASLFAAAITFGVNSSSIYAIPQTLAGPHAAGKWVAVQNSFGNIAGIIAPLVTGWVVDRTGEFFWAFVVAGAVSLAGMAGWGLMIGRIEPLDWPHTTRPVPA